MIQDICAKNKDDLEKVSVFGLNFALHLKNSNFLCNVAIFIFFQL